ncbi:BnaCnng21800D [Brassica napus]|uniref:BnaCnng21800D protein n=1 Tax=Brassica napus TaxID=3708 RepID=A0A078IRL8_BRANA|nr:BnaCnng21800D [Brassica napus]
MNKTEMGSPASGNCSSGLQNYGSESDERKRKRKESNRESARRSRMRKQKHLDDLTAQIAHFLEENSHIVAGISVTTQQYVTIEGENSVLRAQFLELNQRLNSLNEIVEIAGGFWMETGQGGGVIGFYDGVMNPLNLGFYNQTLMASASTVSADVFNCC